MYVLFIVTFVLSHRYLVTIVKDVTKLCIGHYELKIGGKGDKLHHCLCSLASKYKF